MASLKKIKLHIEYLGKVKLSEIAPYKTISCIKDIAKELFEDCPGIFFCTDIEEGLAFGTPLGEWP